MLGLIVLIAAITCLFFRFFSILSQKSSHLDNIPNGSMGRLPFLGETLAFLKPHPSNSIDQFLEHRWCRYGKVFKSHVFGSPTIVSCDLKMTTFILQNKGKLFASSYPRPVRHILGLESTLLVSGEQHKKLRSVMVSHIGSSKSRPDFVHFVDNLSRSLIEFLKSNKQIKLPFLQEAKQFTMHVMLKNVLNLEPEDPVAPIIFKDFLTFMKGFVSLPLNIPGTPFAKAMKARAGLESTVRMIMGERKKRMEKSSPSKNLGDFLDCIMQREELNDEERVSLVLDLLLAGYETTSGLIALLLFFLSRSPKALRHLREEHQHIRKKKGQGQHLNLEDYKQMEFTMKVINEALRCGNLVKFVHRKALMDVKFKEFVIPKGWKVLPVLLATNLDPSLHQNPSFFDPWRWEDETTNKKVLSFCGGARLCPGADLAKLEASFFLHHFTLNFSWKTEEDECPQSLPYLDFKKGLLLEIQPLFDNSASSGNSLILV